MEHQKLFSTHKLLQMVGAVASCACGCRPKRASSSTDDPPSVYKFLPAGVRMNEPPRRNLGRRLWVGVVVLYFAARLGRTTSLEEGYELLDPWRLGPEALRSWRLSRVEKWAALAAAPATRTVASGVEGVCRLPDAVPVPVARDLARLVRAHGDTQPTALNRRGATLKQLGLSGAVAQRIAETAASSCLLPGKKIEVTHAYVASYERGDRLDMHEDDSAVSVNVCLRRCRPAGVTFCGVRGTSGHRQNATRVAHAARTALVHSGLHRHGVSEAAELPGRQNLVLWLKGAGGADDLCESQKPLGDKVDPRCLSYTFDTDHLDHAPYPPDARNTYAERREAADLTASVSAMTEADLAKVDNATMRAQLTAMRHLLTRMAEPASAERKNSNAAPLLAEEDESQPLVISL